MPSIVCTPRIAIVLPAYNEALTIAETIRRFHAVCPESYLFVINNNSSDATSQIAEQTIKEIRAKGGVLHEPRQGKGNAVRRAFLDIDADIYVLCDADLTYPAEKLPELLAPVLSGEADMVCGDRHTLGDYKLENTRKFHNFGNQLVQKLVNAVSGQQLVDILTGYRVMNKTFVKSYPILVEGFQIETDLVLFAAQARLRVVEIPINYINRPEGSVSKLNTYQDGLRILWTVFTIFRQYNPFLFFGCLSVLLCVISLFFGSVVINEWIQTGFITRLPLAVLAVAVGILGALSLSVGVILDAHVFRFKQDLEYRIKNNTTPRHIVE